MAKNEAKNEDYWRKRNAQNMWEYIEGAEDIADEIDKAYLKASLYLQSECDKIFERFKKTHNLSDREARELINKTAGKTIDEIKRELGKGIQTDEKEELARLLNSAAYGARIRRLEEMRDNVSDMMKEVYRNERDLSTEHYIRTAKEGYNKGIFEVQKRMGIGFSFSEIGEDDIDKILKSKWSGTNYSKRIWNNTQALADEMKTEMLAGFMTGKTNREMAKVIQERFAVKAYEARRLVRTESCYVANMTEMLGYEECGIEQYEFNATLDTRTSDICQRLDGKVFDVKDAQPGINMPPMHPNCRSTTTAYFGEEIQGSMARRVRNPETGETEVLPNNIKYEEWKERYFNEPKRTALKADIEAINSKIGELENQKNSSSDERQKKRLQKQIDKLAENKESLLNKLKKLFSKDKKDDIIKTENWKGLNYKCNYTKKKAIRILKKNYGIKFIDSKKYPMDEKLLADCVGWLESFKKQFPEFMKKNPCKLPVIVNRSPGKMNGKVGYYRYNTGTSDALEIALNAKYHSNVNVFSEYIKECVEQNWYPQNATMHKTFVHEFGHHISNSLNVINKNSKWKDDFIDECIEEFRKKEGIKDNLTYKDMGNYVSEYASTKNGELFAETFAEYFGGENPRTFAKIFGEKLENELKKVK